MAKDKGIEINYEDDVSLDEHSLDYEWKRQSSLMGKYCKLKAKLQKEVSLLLEEEKFLRAKLGRKVRRNPDKYKLTKVTDASVGEAVRIQDEFQDINKKIIQAQYELDNAAGAVTSLHQKKAAMEDLVKLHLSQYYSEPNSDPVTSGIKKKINDDQASKIIGRNKKKKKKKSS